MIVGLKMLPGSAGGFQLWRSRRDATMAKIDFEPHSSAKGFRTSLQPIRLWMQLMGVDLCMSTNSACLLFKRLLCSVLLGLNVATFFATWALIGHKKTDGSLGRSEFWNMVITEGNSSVQVTATHAVLVLCTHRRWPRFCDCLVQVEAQVELRGHHFKRMRNMCIAGVIFIIITENLFDAALVCSRYNPSNETFYEYDQISKSYVTFLQIYPTSVVVLFAILARALSLSFGAVDADIIANEKQISAAAINASGDCIVADQVSTLLSKWKLNLAMICECAYQLGECFGVILLFAISCIFVGVINHSFLILNAFTNTKLDLESLISIPLLIKNLFHLWLVCYVCDEIHNSAQGILRDLRKFSLANPQHKEQVSVLMAQMFQSVPKFTAAGFFPINQELIPTLVGTTLTYLIILYQFSK